MTAVALILTALFLLQILELRGRLRAIPVLPPAEGPLRPEHRLLVAQGVELPDAVKSAASAYAAAHDLQVLDLIPGDISAASALTLAMIYDPAACRARPLQRGASLGHAILVHVGLARRFEEGEPLPEHPTRLELARIGLRLRPYAPRQSEVAVAPGLRALPEPARARRALMELYNPLGLAKFALLLRLLLYAFMVAAALTTPWAGWALLGAFQLQPLGTLAGLPFGTRGLLPLTLLRLPLELIDWAALVLHAPPRQSTDALRPAYAELMARGIEPFFEARRPDCPLCESPRLRRFLRMGDRYQRKPGRFTLERCEACGHIFQNPRLSPEGLSFYYKDFYDGLGEEALEVTFGWSDKPYRGRAALMARHAAPKLWLDVGTGHGHFCFTAKELLPDTTFHGLDMGDSVYEARRRGWIAEAVEGFFPERAPDLDGRYDALSMHHYLEHTREPRVELAAAATALGPDGHLLIELPEPESPLGRLLRSWWHPWFQPQHQHFLSRANLARLLDEAGFEALEWQRHEAHQAVDIMAIIPLVVTVIAPKPDLPWRPPSGPVGRLWHSFVWMLAMPLLIPANLCDRLIARLARPLGLSNGYRVVARKRA